jgi:hypothetical protein
MAFWFGLAPFPGRRSCDKLNPVDMSFWKPLCSRRSANGLMLNLLLTLARPGLQTGVYGAPVVREMNGMHGRDAIGSEGRDSLMDKHPLFRRFACGTKAILGLGFGKMSALCGCGNVNVAYSRALWMVFVLNTRVSWFVTFVGLRRESMPQTSFMA